MSRHLILLWWIVILLTQSFTETAMADDPTSGADSQRPNVLLILTDDQRFDTISAWGNTQIHTPHLDALARDGVSFRQASIMGGTHPAVCMPSRAMLLTGRYLFRLRDTGYTLPNDHTTLPEWLRRHGYHTHHVGKWHQDRASFVRSFDSASRIFGFAKGWYETYGGHWNVPLHDYDPSGAYPPENAYILAGDKQTRLPVEAGVGGVHSSELFADAAIEFLDSRQKDSNSAKPDNPFFLYLSFVAPHDPRQSPDAFESMYSSESVDLPPNYLPRHPFDNGEMTVRDEALEAWPRRERPIRRHIADYYAMISHLDQQIGRVIQRLKELGLYDNTLIILTGDNGLAVGQHGLMGKQSVYDHSIRVPLIFAGPGIGKNLNTDTPCYLLDIYPTICEYLGLSIPDSVDGRSLMPAIHDPAHIIRDTQIHAYRDVQRAVRTRRFKLIEYVVDGQRTTQLFDLMNDPWETTNLADDSRYADTLRELRRFLVDQRETIGDTRDAERAFWDGFADP